MYERINKRVDLMIENGLLDEVNSLKEFYKTSRILNSGIGYKELYKYFDGEIKRIDRTLCEQAVYNATQTGAISCIQGQVAQLQALTKTIVPITNVCPQPMPQYNSWTAPTTAA